MHLLYPCFEVKQGRITLYLGTLKFSDLWPRCTVSPRQPREDDPLFSETRKPEEQTPQREANKKRVEEISDFVSKRLDGAEGEKKEVVFPGVVILGLLVDAELDTLKADSTPTAAILEPAVNGLVKLWLPEKSGCLFIIDGQHRLKGLARLEEKLNAALTALEKERVARETPQLLKEISDLKDKLGRLRGFQIPISLLVDFDLAEQAIVFADVNFNQKAVSRSIYWDIFGAFESETVTPISFVHDLVLHLAISDQSPLKGMVKLLGRGRGLVSQAFLSDRLMLLIDPKLSKASFRDFFLRRQKDDKSASRQFAAIIRNYYRAVQSELAYAWPTRPPEGYSVHDYHFILCKSMVMSGLLALLGDIYRLALLDFAFGKEQAVADADVLNPAFFQQFLFQIDSAGRANPAKSEFARGAPWAIGGSASLEKKIYRALRSKVYAAYREKCIHDKSPYAQLVLRFSGSKQAMVILQESPDEGKFWERIDERWTNLTTILS